MAQVYRAMHSVLGTEFALKVFIAHFDQAHASRNERLGKRIHEEGKILARVKHPNMVAVHNAGSDRIKLASATDFWR